MGGFGQIIADRKWEEGRKEGKTEGQREMILRLLQKGKTPEEVSELTDFPVEYIRSVEKSILQTV